MRFSNIALRYSFKEFELRPVGTTSIIQASAKVTLRPLIQTNI